MKRIFKYIFIISMLSMAGFFYISCTDMEKETEFNIYEYPDITLKDFAPKSGRPASSVTIKGENFGDYSDAAKVYFNGTQVTEIVSYSDTLMVVKVPDNAGTGILSVDVWTHHKEFEEKFNYLPGAKILEISAERGSPGDTVTITGENFGDIAADVSVKIGEASAEVIQVSDKELKFKVPDATSGSLIIYVGGQEIESVYFLIGGELITGRLIGHEGSWGDNPATTIEAAVDGDITTSVDAPTSTGFVGYDVGTGKAVILTSVRYVPRGDPHPKRMLGGEIRGANDPSLSDAVTLYTITEIPPEGVYTEVVISTEQSYQYIYYYSKDGFCNIAEIEFYGNYVDASVPEGRYMFEFDNPDDQTWIPQQDASYVIEDNLMKVTFNASQFEGTNKRRADLKFMSTPWIYRKEYPILAIKFTKPDVVNFRPDITGLDSGFNNNDYKTDFESEDVYYWDLSEKTTKDRVECNIFQFKIPDITSAETGYEVDWVRTFSSKEELQTFLGL